PTTTHTLPLHDALPISPHERRRTDRRHVPFTCGQLASMPRLRRSASRGEARGTPASSTPPLAGSRAQCPCPCPCPCSRRRSFSPDRKSTRLNSSHVAIS